MICELTAPEKAAELFGDWEETLIWSCLQGVMGKIFADDQEHHRSAAAVIGDFTFFAGSPCEELAVYAVPGRDFMIMVPQDESWSALIEAVWGEKAKRVERYAIRKEANVFDREKLGQIVPPKGYELRMIDEELYRQCKANEWSRDLVSQFGDYQTFRELALGVVALKNGKIVAGASTYIRYRDGIEIQIDTEISHRRRGLALACGAKLILECLDRGLYPSWDAQNLGSVALAEKLGYHFSHTYPAYEVTGYGER